MNSPAIILHNRALERYEAYNEDGRMITARTLPFGSFVWTLRCYGYTHVPLNSRLGRTIWDKLPLTTQMQINPKG